MDSGASNRDPFMRRQSNKRDFSTMSASHRDDSPFHPARDTHYENEHAARRRRLATELPHSRRHYPGDGLDFRRPVMSSTAAATSSENENERTTMNNAAVIDLTDDSSVQQHLQGSDDSQASSARAPAVPARAQRLPRFGRDVIEVESSGEDDDDDEHDLSHLPGANYLALPLRRTRPQFSGLRRPARPPSPPTDMEDVEFLEARPRPRFRARHDSERPSPAAQYVPRRSATPYPTGLNETIDLTEENDDEIVHLDTRRREGVNNDHPGGMAGFGNRGLEEPVYGQIGRIARVIRDGGAVIGERLMQRLQGVAGLDGGLQAQQQVFDQWNHNHNHRHHIHQQQAHRRRQAQHRAHARPRTNGPQAIRIMQEMPGMMDYNMTAFDLGVEGGGNRPPTPAYSPPPPAAKGFTRGPEEDEVVVCPNCGDELAMGDSDVKQEVWVVKTCGHAYCGECAQNRNRPSPKKGKGKAPVYDDPTLPPPFKKCVVDGCGKPTSKNSMVMAYMGC